MHSCSRFSDSGVFGLVYRLSVWKSSSSACLALWSLALLQHLVAAGSIPYSLEAGMKKWSQVAIGLQQQPTKISFQNVWSWNNITSITPTQSWKGETPLFFCLESLEIAIEVSPSPVPKQRFNLGADRVERPWLAAPWCLHLPRALSSASALGVASVFHLVPVHALLWAQGWLLLNSSPDEVCKIVFHQPDLCISANLDQPYLRKARTKRSMHNANKYMCSI